MTSQNEARPEGRAKQAGRSQIGIGSTTSHETNTHDWSEFEGEPSRQNQQAGANIGASVWSPSNIEGYHSDRHRHQNENHVVGTKRQAAEMSPDDTRIPKAMKHDPTTVDVDMTGNSMPPWAVPRNNIWQGTKVVVPSPFPRENIWEGTNVVIPSPDGTGYISYSDPSTAGGKKLSQIVAEQMAKLSHTGEVIMYTGPVIDKNLPKFESGDILGLSSSKLRRAIQEANLRMSGHSGQLQDNTVSVPSAKLSDANKIMTYTAPVIDKDRATFERSDVVKLTFNDMKSAIQEANLRMFCDLGQAARQRCSGGIGRAEQNE